MGRFILSMSCVSGDQLQVAINERADILKWLKHLDHEGSNWSVVVHHLDPCDNWLATDDLTDQIRKEYEQGA